MGQQPLGNLLILLIRKKYLREIVGKGTAPLQAILVFGHQMDVEVGYQIPIDGVIDLIRLGILRNFIEFGITNINRVNLLIVFEVILYDNNRHRFNFFIHTMQK